MNRYHLPFEKFECGVKSPAEGQTAWLVVAAPPLADWVTLGKSFLLSELKMEKKDDISWEVKRAEYQGSHATVKLSTGLAYRSLPSWALLPLGKCRDLGSGLA